MAILDDNFFFLVIEHEPDITTKKEFSYTSGADPSDLYVILRCFVDFWFLVV